jgi:AraC family transcriptional regulator, positive regulator of tynA and feaB
MVRLNSARTRWADIAVDKIIATSEVHPRDRFDYWYEVTRQTFGPYQSDVPQPASFNGEFRTLRLNGLTVSTVHSSYMRAWRGPQQSARNPDMANLIIQLWGTTKFQQDGREAVVNIGDFALIDLKRPCAFRHADNGKYIAITLDRRDLEARLGPLSRWTARRVDGNAGTGALASTFVRALPDQMNSLSDQSQFVIASQLIDLVALAFKELEGTGFVHSSARLASLLRLKSVVEGKLPDSSATCEEIAAAAGISVRYANQLLDAEGTSLQKLLYAKRLERCSAALADPAQSYRQISDIAFSWGFADVSHFGRLFKAMTGMSPREYRKRNMGAVDPI